MINPRISAVWSTPKPIAPFSSTPRVQEVHTKARPEVMCTTSALVCTSCTRDVQENGDISLVLLKTPEILGLIMFGNTFPIRDI